MAGAGMALVFGIIVCLHSFWPHHQMGERCYDSLVVWICQIAGTMAYNDPIVSSIARLQRDAL